MGTGCCPRLAHLKSVLQVDSVCMCFYAIAAFLHGVPAQCFGKYLDSSLAGQLLENAKLSEDQLSEDQRRKVLLLRLF